MNKLGLVGSNISHSKSPEVYHKLLKGNVDYHLFDFPNEQSLPNLDRLFEKVDGLSITAPYKKTFLKEVSMSSDVLKLGAINCIRKANSTYEGTNTDFLALNEILDNFLRDYGKINIVLLGDGAMANILTVLLCRLNISFKQFSRKITSKFNSLEIKKSLFLDSHKIFVINACSRNYLFNGHIDSEIDFFDLNYSSPEQENFFINRPNKYIDGIDLLEGQARHALKFWGIE